METELFGDRAATQEQLLDYLEETVQNDFRLKPEYEKMRGEYLQFKDHEHSRHICEEIKIRYCVFYLFYKVRSAQLMMLLLIHAENLSNRMIFCTTPSKIESARLTTRINSHITAACPRE